MTRSATNITWLGGLAFVLLLLGSLGIGGCHTRVAEAAAERNGHAATNHVPDPIAPAVATN